MSRQASPALIGGFVVGAVALVVAAVLIFGGGDFLARKKFYVLFFDGSVKGLNVGAPVKFRGVNIGAVTDVGVLCDARDLSFHVRVVIETEPERIQGIGSAKELRRTLALHESENILGMLVEQGLRAQLQLQSLVTGQLFVQLDLYPDTPVHYTGLAAEYPEIPTIPSGLEELSRSLEQVPFDRVVERLMHIAEGVERLVNAPELAGSIRALEGTLNAVQGAAKSADAQVTALVADLRQTLGEARALLRNIDGQVAPLSRKTQEAAEAARGALVRAEGAFATLGEATADDSALRRQLQTTLEEMSSAARSIRILGETLEARPDALLRGKPAEGGDR